ncbi:GroES-like protein [Lophiostoma macrostomum CBS 122681]|uniref:GroES-like protein n=1 Tax=Lophiostoma macrostomum CBS 122681 TaxID=1314788 RepID=A0A6A6T9X6_9PLEO|nr:GroES-like protein [Lophiostoma macrostomum CBS 122681]
MTTIKAWQFTTAVGGIENNLFQPASGVSKPQITDDQVLVEVYSAALNPADYKVAELGAVVKPFIPNPFIPGMDFCGRVAETGNKVDTVRIGEMVFGAVMSPLGHGSLSQYVAVPKTCLTAMPEGLEVDDAASIAVAGTTAYRALKENAKAGDRVFVNGGSGGTGIWTLQIAKVLGCHVTTSCSTPNIELCKSLGADKVLDYKAADIITQLQGKGQIFNLCIDNVGTPSSLYKVSHKFLVPGGKFIQIGMGSGLESAMRLAHNSLVPASLGGGKRKYQMPLAKIQSEHLAQIGTWMKEGKVKAVIDTKFEWDEAPSAYLRLKTGRARGKVVVRVKDEQ